MKKFFTTLLLVAVISNLFAEIAVKSFRKLENDMDARINEPLKDQNGDVCAIIKVVTTQTGFSSFDCGMTGVVKTVQKPSEIWVYVPYGAKRITITHPQLGLIRDYFFPVPIEKATVYEMVLITGRVETTVVDEMTSQWLVINPDPADAMIYLNDQYVKSGMFQSKLKPGSYTYRVELALYHPEAGKVEITDTKKEVNVKLKPAFGFFSVNTEPESGARVIIDGKTQAEITPFKSEALSSGIYTVQVVKEMYQPATQKVTVIDGQTTPLNFILQPNFGYLTINAPADATVYINNQLKGNGLWQGKLNAGIYYLEVRSDKHRPAKKELNILAGNKDTVDLQPTPIYGSLDVMTNPPGAKILIDNKEYGTTPNTIYNLPIGDCKVQLIKEGYATMNSAVVITDGRSTELSETLLLSNANVNNVPTQTNNQILTETNSNRRLVNIVSNPTNAKLFIDDKLVGQTPFEGSLSIGYHNLRAEQGMEKLVKNIIIDQNGGETNFKFTFSQQAFMETTGKLLDANQIDSASNKMPALNRSVGISSNPSEVNLYIDGNLVGQTPYNGTLSFGSHILSIEQNGQKVDKTITISQSGGETEFSLSFTERPGMNNSSSMTKTINFTSTPSNADIYIDGKLMGKTPATIELAYGNHRFNVTNGAKKNTQEIEINNETSNSIYFGLFDCYSEKTISSNPSGATVLVNGEEKGMTPLIYTMLNKEDEIVINQKGYQPYKGSISCDSKGLSANLTLDKGKRTHLYLEGGISFPLIDKSNSTNINTTPVSGTSSVTDSLIYTFRIGIVKTTGGYVKLTTNMSFKNFDYKKGNLPKEYYYVATSSTPVMYTSRFGVVGGFMLNVKPVMFFAGAGYGYYNHYTTVNLYKYADDKLVDNKSYVLGDNNSIYGLELDGGFVLYKGFGAISVSFSSIQFKYNELTLGLGLVF